MKFKTAIVFATALLAALSFFLYEESLKKDVNINVVWNNKSGKKLKETIHLQVPETK